MVFDKNALVASANVWLGKKDKIDMVIKDKVVITFPNNEVANNVKFKVRYYEPIFTPIKVLLLPKLSAKSL